MAAHGPIVGETDRKESVLDRALRTELDALYRFARRMGLMEADAEDVLQEVALVCARKGDVEVENARAYLFGVAFKIATRIRDRVRREAPPSLAMPNVASDPSDGPEAALQDRQARRLLDAILDSLPDDERAVFILCEIEEETMAEVAVQLSLPAGTVASRLRRARESFANARKRLERREPS
ncbi:RNA polymerase sigma factor [soil metagenome]